MEIVSKPMEPCLAAEVALKSGSISVVLPLAALLTATVNALPRLKIASGASWCSPAPGYEPCSSTNCANKLAPGVDCAAISAAKGSFTLSSLRARTSPGSDPNGLSASTESSGGQGTGSQASSSNDQGTQTSTSGDTSGLGAGSVPGLTANSTGSGNSSALSGTGSSGTGSSGTGSSDMGASGTGGSSGTEGSSGTGGSSGIGTSGTGSADNGLSASSNSTRGSGTGSMASSSNGQGTQSSSSGDTSGLDGFASLPGFPEDFPSLADLKNKLEAAAGSGGDGLSADTSSSGGGQSFSSSSNGKETKTSKSGFRRRRSL
ncbi:MAG: hypothetical protein Q9170_004218 [Blastenia crenularia]